MTTIAAAIQSVLIDPRQPPILDHLGYGGAATVRAPLAAGSINVLAHDGALLAIERLPVESLPMAIRHHTLTDRAAALRALTPWAYLVIVGELVSDHHGKAVIAGRPSGWDWRSVQGALATVQELGVIVIGCGHDDHLSDLLITLARRARGPARVSPPRELLFTTPQELLLQALPGIGEDKAEQLLTQCGTAARALVALTHADYAPPGIGPKTIADARRVLGLADNERLSLDLTT
jgi:ERCC4-type nuclease